jgi:hypothetical protein
MNTNSDFNRRWTQMYADLALGLGDDGYSNLCVAIFLIGVVELFPTDNGP